MSQVTMSQLIMLAAMHHAIEVGYPTSFACHIWGQAACEEASRMDPAPAGTVAKLGKEATHLMVLILQVKSRRAKDGRSGQPACAAAPQVASREVNDCMSAGIDLLGKFAYMSFQGLHTL
eukprot:1146330-Pelagomonas_calceolata.AAC.7